MRKPRRSNTRGRERMASRSIRNAKCVCNGSNRSEVVPARQALRARQWYIKQLKQHTTPPRDSGRLREDSRRHTAKEM